MSPQTTAQLATEIDERSLQQCLDRDAIGVSQKLDGQRLLLSIKDGGVQAFNRNGGPRQCPPALAKVFATVSGPWVLDGELMRDGRYMVFDLLVTPPGDITAMPLSSRLEFLHRVVEAIDSDLVSYVPVITEDKDAFVIKMMTKMAEGVVVKDLNARYRPGRNLNFLKYKFVHHVDCYVSAVEVDGKSNLELEMYDPEQSDFVSVGRCSSLTGDGKKVKIGDVVTVKILYSTEGGRLYHATLPQIRTDKTPMECTTDQLDRTRTQKDYIHGNG